MSPVQTRLWQPQDDASLVDILTRQLKQDKAWPPPYAHDLDLAAWLAKPADLNRWVAVHEDQIVGHMGLGNPAQPQLEKFVAALGHADIHFAELCRTCIAPEFRQLGIASLLTRVAIKHAISIGRIAVSTVLTNRTAWLSNMLETGWRDVGRLETDTEGTELVCLFPPQKFVDAVLNPTDQSTQE